MRFSVLAMVLVGCTEHGSGGPLPDSNPLGDGPIILVDASFTCVDDSAFGPNDSIATAFQTPVANAANEFAAQASICPANDKDTYAISLPTQSSLRVITTWASGEPVTSSILNQGGTSLGNSVAMGTDTHCVCLNNLPAGTFFASVVAGTGVQNNYTVHISKITAAECSAPPACN